MTISGILDRIRVLLQDPTGIRWTDQEILNSIAEGQQFIANVRPDSTSSVIDVTVTANSYLVTLPTTARRLLDVLGTSTGATVTSVEMGVLDRHAPNWRTETGDSIRHFIYEDRDPSRLYVYPMPTAPIVLRALVSANPPDTVSLVGNLSIDSSFVGALVDLATSRALEKESAAASVNKSVQFKQSALDRLKILSGADASNSPAANEGQQK